MAAGQQLGEANALGSMGAKGALSLAKKGAGLAATGGWAAAKMAADPLKTAKRAGGAVVGAAVGAYQGIKSAVQGNETLGAIGSLFRSRNKNTGIKSERSLSHGRSAGGSRVHTGGFGNRSKLESIEQKPKRDIEAPQLSSRPRLDDAPSLPKQMPGRSREF